MLIDRLLLTVSSESEQLSGSKKRAFGCFGAFSCEESCYSFVSCRLLLGAAGVVSYCGDCNGCCVLQRLPSCVLCAEMVSSKTTFDKLSLPVKADRHGRVHSARFDSARNTRDLLRALVRTLWRQWQQGSNRKASVSSSNCIAHTDFVGATY